MDEDFMFGFFVVSVVLLFFFVIFVGLKDQEKSDSDWKNFASGHHCHLVSTSNGSTGVGLTSRGSIVSTYEPGKDGYLCDDGVIHYRDN